MQNKKPFEIILHERQVTSLRGWMAKKSCHGQTLTNECPISDYPSTTLLALNYYNYYFQRFFFVLHSSDVIFSFLIKKARQKAIEIEIAFFHSLGDPKGHRLDHFFYASHIRHNFPYKLYR